MGSSTPYVSREDTTRLRTYETVATAYAHAINKNSTEWGGKELRGFIEFLWKTKHHRAHLAKREPICGNVDAVKGARSAHKKYASKRKGG